MFMLTGMVTEIRKGSRPHLYIEDHLRARDMSDTKLAGRLDVARETVYRWRTEQHRLNPEKIAAIADALGIEPEDLWSPPTTRTNLNVLAKLLDDHDFETIEITFEKVSQPFIMLPSR